MTKLHVINDLHIGVQRSAGTTPASAWNLRQYVLEEYTRILSLCDSDVLINGDMFDGYSINYTDLLAAFSTTTQWLKSTGHKLFLSAGNHDLSTNSTKLSSFEFFGNLLVGLYPKQVQVIRGGVDIGFGRYVISHVANQDLFNLELERVPQDCTCLFLHCNYDNYFAQQSDNSLNLSKQQALLLTQSGRNIVMGHEHHHRWITLEAGYVYITGNQIPSSVSDCLNAEDKKMISLTQKGELEEIKLWDVKQDYVEVSWDALPEFTGSQRFIRVCGNATPAQAAEVVGAISKFRSKSCAFVITNAVKLLGEEGEIEFVESAEQIKTFDVLSALLEMLTPEESLVVKSVLEQS